MPSPESCIRRNFEAFNKHDAQGVIDTYTEDCEIVDVAAPEPSYGHAILHEHMDSLLRVFPDMHIENERLLSGEHLVAAEFELVGTHSGDFLGHPASGNVLRWVTCSFFDLTDDDERIKRETYYYDLGSVVAQLQSPADRPEK